MMTHDLLAKSSRIFLFDELEDYASAIEKLSEYLKANPRSGVAYNNRGLAYAEIGRGDEALLDFAMAMEYSPDDPIPYINRSDLYQRAQPTARLDEAIEDLSRAIAINDNDVTFHRARAYACLEAGRSDEAIDSFSAAVQLDPEFRQTYIDRGKTYQQRGEAEKAQQDFERASNLPPYPVRR